MRACATALGCGTGLPDCATLAQQKNKPASGLLVGLMDFKKIEAATPSARRLPNAGAAQSLPRFSAVDKSTTSQGYPPPCRRATDPSLAPGKYLDPVAALCRLARLYKVWRPG
jgi:hypothetical protein